jgi:general nucleoside transport system permease protein
MAENSLPLKTRRLIAPLLTFIIVIVLALLIGAVAVAITGKSPLLAIQELIQGAIGTQTSLAATLTRSIPIIINGIAAAAAFKAGLFNLGLEGQMVIGALVAALVANIFRDLPPILLLPLTIISGCVAGGLLALPTAWWQISFKVPLLISTLLLNYIADLFASYLVNYPLRDLTGGAAVPQTVMIPEAIRFGIILPGTRLHAGVIVLVILPIVVAWFFQRTSLGFSVRMSGLNPNFAEYGGINMPRVTLLAMFGSGAIAGLAGVIQVLGVDFRFIDGALTTPGIAWTGFIAAILAGSSPLGIVAAGLFLAGLKVGAAGMQRNTQIPLQIADIVQAGVIFMAAIRLKIGSVVKRLVEPNQ